MSEHTFYVIGKCKYIKKFFLVEIEICNYVRFLNFIVNVFKLIQVNFPSIPVKNNSSQEMINMISSSFFKLITQRCLAIFVLVYFFYEIKNIKLIDIGIQ